MQPLHFTKTPIQKHKAVRLWFSCSLMLLIGILITITIFQVHQWIAYASLVSQKQTLAQQLRTFDAIMATMQTQKTEQEMLQKKYMIITQQKKQSQHMADMLKHIKASLKPNAHLESLTYAGDHIEMKIAAENTRTLNQIAQSITTKEQCKDMSITAFEYKDKNHMVAILQANKISS